MISFFGKELVKSPFFSFGALFLSGFFYFKVVFYCANNDLNISREDTSFFWTTYFSKHNANANPSLYNLQNILMSWTYV